MLKKRRLVLIFSIALLGVILAINFFAKKEISDRDYALPIEKKLQGIIRDFDQDYIQVLMENRPEEAISFTSLNLSTNHEFYLYNTVGDLVYWSDITMIPEFGAINLDATFQLVENQKGIYFAKLRRFNRNQQGYYLLQVITLLDKVEIQNEFLNQGHNRELFGNERFSLSEEQLDNYVPLYSQDDEYLFSIFFHTGYQPVGQTSVPAFLIFFFSILALVLILGGDFVIKIWKKGKSLLALFYTTLFLFSLRAIMIFFNFPQDFLGGALFDPSYYASSYFNSSLGDLMLNVICSVVIISMIVGIFGRKKFLFNFLRLKGNHPDWIFILATFLLSTALLLLFFNLYLNIVNNSQWDLNILAITGFDYLMLISMVIIFLGGAGYLLFTIVALNLVLYECPYPQRSIIWYMLGASIPLLGFLAYWDRIYFVVFLAHIILLLAIVSLKLYHNIFKLGFNTFLTFFFGCLMGAIITGAASYQNIRVKTIQSKEKFANQILLENDVMAEFLLGDIMDKISEDIFIKSSLTEPLQQKEPIVQKIKKIYIPNYFDQYELDVKVFNAAGEEVITRNAEDKLMDLRMKYMKSDLATSIKNLYFIKGGDEGISNNFYAFTNLYRDQKYIGTIYLELRQLRIQPSSIFPKLLLDANYIADFQPFAYDYALFRNESLEYAIGVFNYRSPEVSQLLDNPNLFFQGVILNQYHHFGVKDQNKILLVSSKEYPTAYVLADVALFFVTYLFFTLISMLIYTLLRGVDKVQFNYATKLQLYLNFAFFLPMLIISVIAGGLISNSYREELHNRYFEKAETIRDNLNPFLDQQSRGLMGKDEVLTEVYTLAATTATDVNIYAPNGYLIATNQPNIFEKKILSTNLNPEAYAGILETQNNRLLLNEKVGNLNYKTVYLAVRDSDKQEILGVIAIPFFESEEELKLLIADVFSNILNIFVLIFILFLVVSYFVSKRLTFPFKLLMQKLKTTNLDNNEPMYWPTKDEIGLLIDEYNNMLFKLEASKKVLASNEKESAWREMAKQVAHEIKNPLTPMKLTLQHLLRLQSEGKLEDPSKLKKPVETLILQVDTLSDIATSFSTFAKMPLPKNESIDFKMVIKDAVELFRNHPKGQVVFKDQVDQDVYVLGDAKLFSRIISNLIINGIQAVKSGKSANIEAILTLDEKKEVAQLEIKDNGVGISLDLRDKIFTPNFSTKSEGSGLGLAIAKRGVETASGRIWFETEVGKGTSFFLVFPILKLMS
ncbi:sensor histidine kinase [Pararhodonellum marinum]|uniref:sensor histidine kinase n=1 Tax=Pararhodonellum marinum TaxID=2755358 RepID=UPI00188F9D67|nr:ATP-binding protein [Pararhodonellum marinum]